MSDKIRMNFDQMEDMARSLHDSAEKLEEMGNHVAQLADVLDDGVLVGVAGIALSQAMRQDLAKAMTRIHDKLDEMEKDVRDAMQDMRSADKAAGSLYQSR
jgi:WXG100 family type VII secretion target